MGFKNQTNEKNVLCWGNISFKYVQHPIPKFYSAMVLDVEQNSKSSRANVTLNKSDTKSSQRYMKAVLALDTCELWIVPQKRHSLATHTPYYLAVPGPLGSRTLLESSPLLPLRGRCRLVYDISPTCQIPRREKTNVEKMNCIHCPCQWVLMSF